MRLIIPKGARPVEKFDDWTLYELVFREGGSFLWPAFKLMLPKSMRAKWGQRRAFWIAWNALELRFQRSGESQRLEELHPILFGQVETYLSLNYDKDWLLDPHGMGVTEEEIQVEITRLKAERLERARATR
jgi:hypothetical protein